MAGGGGAVGRKEGALTSQARGAPGLLSGRKGGEGWSGRPGDENWDPERWDSWEMAQGFMVGLELGESPGPGTPGPGLGNT